MAYGIDLNTRRWRVCEGERCRNFKHQHSARDAARNAARANKDSQTYEYRTPGGWDYAGICHKTGDCSK